MGKILAAVLTSPGCPVEVREFDEPHLEMDSALFDVALSEVCGTDVHLRQGHLSGVPYPIIPGHVSAGTISRIRGTLTDVEGRKIREGETVTFLDVHRTCGACWYCSVAKAGTRCPHRKVYGVTYGLADGLAGGWAQSIYLKPGTRCVSLAGADIERFMSGGCSLPTALHAVELAQVSFGATVLVLGSGPVGLSSIICAFLRGAHRVLCIGAPEVRLQIAARVGACATLDFTSCSRPDRVQWVHDLTGGRGADITIEATGNPEAVVDAMKYTRDAGRIVVVGQYTDAGEASFNPHLDLNKKHLDILGCWGCDFSHVYRGVQLMSDPVRSAHWSPVPLKRYSLGEANQALDDVACGCSHKALIDPWRPS
jgi:threonine dehydrogenase-like Zn-dependent dehydrogenase